MFQVGVISDTHNYLDPLIPHLFAGVDHILHGGDIGMPAIILALEQIAPVTAVAGNTDDPGFQYPPTSLVELGGRRFLVHHIVNPQSLTEPIRTRIARERWCSATRTSRFPRVSAGRGSSTRATPADHGSVWSGA